MRFASRANLNELFENNYERREKQRTMLLNAMLFPTSNNDQSEDKDRYELLQLSMNDLLFGICRPYIYILKHSFCFQLFRSRPLSSSIRWSEWKWYKVLKAFTHNSQRHKRKYSWGIVYWWICYSKRKKWMIRDCWVAERDEVAGLISCADVERRILTGCLQSESILMAEGKVRYPLFPFIERSHHPLLSSKPQSVCSTT